MSKKNINDETFLNCATEICNSLEIDPTESDHAYLAIAIQEWMESTFKVEYWNRFNP